MHFVKRNQTKSPTLEFSGALIPRDLGFLKFPFPLSKGFCLSTLYLKPRMIYFECNFENSIFLRWKELSENRGRHHSRHNRVHFQSSGIPFSNPPVFSPNHFCDGFIEISIWDTDFHPKSNSLATGRSVPKSQEHRNDLSPTQWTGT